VTLSLSGFLGYVAYTLHRSTQRHPPPSIPAEYMEHLFMVGGVAFRPRVLTMAVGIVAALLFAAGVYLLLPSANKPASLE
jgi:hypothetical protein